MTSTNPTVRGLEARRASLAPGAYLGIVHVSPGERLGPIGRGAVLPEVLDHVEAIETELAESRAAHGRELETSLDLKTRLAAQSLQLAAARAIPAHTQKFIDDVRESLGAKTEGKTPAQRVALRIACIGLALDMLDTSMRGAR